MVGCVCFELLWDCFHLLVSFDLYIFLHINLSLCQMELFVFFGLFYIDYFSDPGFPWLKMASTHHAAGVKRRTPN